MHRPEHFTRLLFPGALALLTGIAMGLNPGYLLELLFLAGLIYPGLIVSGFIAFSAARIGFRTPTNWTVLSLSGIVVAWIALVVLMGYGIWDVPQEVATLASIATGVACFLVPVWERWGRPYAIALAVVMVFTACVLLIRGFR
jgi:hypothetical protein